MINGGSRPISPAAGGVAEGVEDGYVTPIDRRNRTALAMKTAEELLADDPSHEYWTA
jgi:hypothetical protein